MDHDDLLAAMYADDETPQPTNKPVEAGNARTRKIHVGVVQYEVPTKEYMQYLEQLVMRQAQTIEQMQREMTRLRTDMHGTRNFLVKQNNNLADVRRELATRRIDLP